MKNIRMLFVIVVTLTIAMGANAATINVPAGQPTIQAAINAAAPGDTILISAGTYDENLNIDSKTNLTIAGVDKTTTIIKSSTTRSWAIPGYPGNNGRLTVIRIYNSSVTTIENMTIDCDLIKDDGKYGIIGWDSAVTVNNCILKNISVPDTMSGGYSEIMTYFRAVGASFTDTSRAAVNITGNTFIDAGRVGIVTHDFVLANISGNTFYKTFDDFGYALELGSTSKGSITGNIIYGYDTPAASDGSLSAGLYIENSFTNGITTPITKDVLVQDNEIYGCQYVMTVGNEWPGYTGNVDIVLTLQGNNFHNNVSGGVFIADEGKDAGSSVTVTGSGNNIADNNEFGYYVYTFGNGDITVDLSNETISGNQVGLYAGDYASGTSSSSYAVSINNSNIVGNPYGIYSDIGDFTTVDANNNWWGKPNGPGPVGPGLGDRVSSNVSYSSWLAKPANDNVVYLEPTDSSVYVKPSETVIVDMKVANLQQRVTALQAMLNFSSTYFKTGPSDVIVAPGGGVWEELIYDVWNTGGDLDVAVGINLASPTGTDADATTGIMTLKPTGTEGITQMVFRADADPDPGLIQSTYMTDESSEAVWPAKVNSTNIYIDGTPPTDVNITANPVSWTKNSPVVLTFSATDALSGIDHYELSLNGAGYITATSPYNWDVSALATGTYPATVKAVDKAGNEATASTTVYIDKTNPVISITSAKQNSVELIPSGTAVQGVVNIQVTASDATSGLSGQPTVTVTPNGGSPEAAAFVNESPSGTFNYTWTVSSTTANGTATINASVSDNAGNSANAASKTFNVNKNQITGQVELQNFVGASRAVTFVATGGTKKTWTQTLAFSGGVASYTLTDVPAGTTNMSAKAAWNLRKKLAAALDSDGQAIANFTSSAKLLGGDINGSNTINILDYSILKINWFTTNAVADIDGDGSIGLLDYSIMKANWFIVGDPE